jgi:hypothetical protein
LKKYSLMLIVHVFAERKVEGKCGKSILVNTLS